MLALPWRAIEMTVAECQGEQLGTSYVDDPGSNSAEVTTSTTKKMTCLIQVLEISSKARVWELRQAAATKLSA